MTFAPTTLIELGAYWKANGGVNLGIVGDTDHAAKGVSYHLGKDQLAPDAYSARLPRDKAGLSNAASAIDLGKLDGTLTGLRDFSRWLVSRCTIGAEGSQDVREIIYSPDGTAVQRWSGVDNTIHTGPGNGDVSHRTHTHISYYRDSEHRNKRTLFAPYFAEDEMLSFTLTRETEDVIVTIDGASAIRLDDGELIPVRKDEVKEAMAFGRLAKPFGTGQGAQADRQSGFLLFGNRPAWLLAYAAREVPATGGDVKQKVAIAVNGTIRPETQVEV